VSSPLQTIITSILVEKHSVCKEIHDFKSFQDKFGVELKDVQVTHGPEVPGRE
jgi:hypothetical protein